jgi:hypothetical protein
MGPGVRNKFAMPGLHELEPSAVGDATATTLGGQMKKLTFPPDYFERAYKVLEKHTNHKIGITFNGGDYAPDSITIECETCSAKSDPALSDGRVILVEFEAET